jgi:hypothetical protein
LKKPTGENEAALDISNIGRHYGSDRLSPVVIEALDLGLPSWSSGKIVPHSHRIGDPIRNQRHRWG